MHGSSEMGLSDVPSVPERDTIQLQSIHVLVVDFKFG